MHASTLHGGEKMKPNLARILLFSVIATLSIILLGSTPRSQEPNNSAKELEKIAVDFQDIPDANRVAWNQTAVCNSKLLIRLSTSKLVGITNSESLDN